MKNGSRRKDLPAISFRRRLKGRLKQGLWALGFLPKVPKRPLQLMMEATNACNLRCIACPIGEGRLGRPPQAMRFEDFKKMLDECLDPPGYLRRITFHNYGEPFLCADLLRMVRYAADHGVSTTLSTNGHFFKSGADAVAVVASGMSSLTIALDGADQETLTRYRKSASFTEVVEGARRLMEARSKAGSSTPIVALQFIIMKHNEHQIDRMKALVKELGVDHLILKTVSIEPTDPDFQRLASELTPSNPSYSRYTRLDDGRYALRGAPPAGCGPIHHTMVVNSNGDVVPCCYDAHVQWVLGNVFRQSVAEVWRGKSFSEFRKRVLLKRNSIVACRECPVRRVNMTF